MATPAAIVAGAQRVSITSARLDAVGEASATRVSRRPHAGSAPVARAASATRVSRRPHAGSAPVARASPAVRLVSARAVKRWGPPLNVWSRFASFPRCASRLH